MKQQQIELDEQSDSSDVDERAADERVRLERELGEMRRQADTSITPLTSRIKRRLVTTTEGTVTKVNHNESKEQLRLRVDINDKVFTFRFDWPSSPDEYSEDMQLIRLLNYVGVRPNRLADLHGKKIPVVDTGTRYKPAIPASNSPLAHRTLRFALGLMRIGLTRYKRTPNGPTYRPTVAGMLVLSLLTAGLGQGIHLVGLLVGIVPLAFIGVNLASAATMLAGIMLFALILRGIFALKTVVDDHIWPF